MCVLGQPEPVDSALTFPSGYDTLEYTWVKAATVSVRLQILFVMLQNTNTCLNPSVITQPSDSWLRNPLFTYKSTAGHTTSGLAR